MSVSVIIPAWNESKALKATMEALLDIDYDKKECEIIVVAGGDDDTHEIALRLSEAMDVFPRYIVIPQVLRGKNYAIQQGIKEAKHDIIVLLDADTIVGENWLKRMVNPIEQGTCDLTTGNPEPAKKSWISDYYMITKTYLFDSITTYSGNSMAFRASIVENRLEYFFDRSIRVGVDYLLAKRFSEQGRRIMFVKDAVVKTYLPTSLKYFVLTELRWLTAHIDIDGVSWRALTCNTIMVLALITTIPVSRLLFIMSLVFHSFYIFKRVRMFLISSRSYQTNGRSLVGFIILSYVYHVIGFVCYMRHFLGMSKRNYLYQGQRH
jgi:cellulose synthase/poly-beta-1,6-N-acetylglucosamine synthase-like glycosyltransferase